jgi:hypothetical protein
MIDKKITMMTVKVAMGIEIMPSFSVGTKESALGGGVIMTGDLLNHRKSGS